MCNCSSIPANICTQCSQGQQCGCPPDYTILPQPVPCKCCPSGYTFYTDAVFPNGICKGPGGSIPPIPCTPCVTTTSSDCVILPEITCFGIAAGTTLTSFLNYMCSAAFIQVLLGHIGLDPSLASGFCQLVGNCPTAPTSTTPVIGPIIITFP